MIFATLIAGPTASGKSALAIRLAEATGACILNADSMQVYRDLAILSARPDAQDEARAPHHLFGFVPATTEFSVGQYVEAARTFIENARARHEPLIIVGGTGLYFRALTEGLMPSPPVPDKIRKRWRAHAASGADLHAALMLRDPARAAALHPHDQPRLLRAIELFEATGKPYSRWLSENPGEPILPPGLWRGVFLAPEREALQHAINNRFETMVARGALDEVSALMQAQPPLPANLGIMKAHGIPHLAAHLRGEIPLAQAVALGQQDTRAYARRQMIFARKFLAGVSWSWFDSAEAAASWLMPPR
jgi:tRNA dimethylallyltransferase